MNYVTHNTIVYFIWGIADDVLRDVYVRGKYRDVILPMTVIRRLDALLEPTKEKVLDMKKQLDAAGIANQDAALCQAVGQAFYIDPGKTQVGYEISFTRHFYKPVPMRTSNEIKADIFALEEESEGLLEQIVGGKNG
jgi:type I restriction-modification system DNA methylase subunit